MYYIVSSGGIVLYCTVRIQIASCASVFAIKYVIN